MLQIIYKFSINIIRQHIINVKAFCQSISKFDNNKSEINLFTYDQFIICQFIINPNIIWICMGNCSLHGQHRKFVKSNTLHEIYRIYEF